MDNSHKKEKSRITLSFPGKEKKIPSEDISRKKSSSSSGNTTPPSAERRVNSLDEMKSAYQERKKQSGDPQLPK